MENYHGKRSEEQKTSERKKERTHIATNRKQQKHKQEFSIKDYMFTRPEYVQVTNSFLCYFVFSLHPHFLLCVDCHYSNCMANRHTKKNKIE